MIENVDISFSYILLDEKLYENVRFITFHTKTSIVPKSLCIRFDKIDGFFRIRRGEFRYLLLFDHGLFDKILPN